MKTKVTILAAIASSLMVFLLAGCGSKPASKTQTTVLPSDDQASLMMAEGMIRESLFDSALAELNKVTNKSGSNYHYLVAQCYLGQDNTAEAYTHIEQALQNNPNSYRNLSVLGQIRFLQKQYPQSAEAYRQALNYAANDEVRSQLQYNLAMTCMAAGQFTRADEHFQEYLKHQNYVTNDDKMTAGAIAYAVGDHKRAFNYWKDLSTDDKNKILVSVQSESEQYQNLVTSSEVERW